MWTPTDDNAGLQCNGEEKFHHFTEWLEYLIQNFLAPWGYVVDGAVRWRGEDEGDVGTFGSGTIGCRRAWVAP